MAYEKRSFLSSDRLKLVALEKEHLPKRVEFINDPSVQATLNFDYPTSLSKTEAWLAKNALSSNRVDFTILSTTDGVESIIGFGGYVSFDRVVRKAELYIFIGKEYWSSGFGKEAYKLITNYGFLELGLNRVYGYQLDYNIKALNSVKSIGWSEEGLLREDVFSHGKLKNRLVVSILRKEWMENKTYDDV